ncbi:hypothetical protein [Streptomyces buecherae]|uniref:Uncharacterized protein n=1 Tax=Streptomyces buecherae TaxID=2763006 RepID=A0A7H8NAP1_9ACTN|nr:hypothetical protein [Streptomyces buecherae]QKW51599.1 hypothetical protein HUT08_21095 [Streptomyces buecherae]
MNEDEPTVKDVSKVKRQSNDLSRDLLGIINLRSDLDPPGYVVGLCGDRDSEKFYRINNFWSIAGPSVADMRAAMDRLVTKLPENGWEIAENGRENTQVKSHYLKANNEDSKFSVYIVLREPSPHSDRTRPLLSVSLVSACHQAPQGQSTGY